MKKLLSLLAVFISLSIVACGPSAEEKAAAEKATQDSIAAAVQKAVEDSMIAAQAAEQALNDSISMAIQKAVDDSLAKVAMAAKPKTKPKTTTTKPEEPKIGKKKPGMN